MTSGTFLTKNFKNLKKPLNTAHFGEDYGTCDTPALPHGLIMATTVYGGRTSEQDCKILWANVFLKFFKGA